MPTFPVRSRPLRVVLIAALVGLGALGVARPAHGSTRSVHPDVAGAGQVTVMTFNMCGEHCNNDSTGADITSLLEQVNAHDPQAVLLQEVCGKEFTALVDASAESGNWRLVGAHDVTEKHGCTGGDTFGDAVLVHNDVTPFETKLKVKALKYPHGKGKNRQVRKTLCLRTTGVFPRTTEICTVHAGLDFEIGAKHQAAQVKQAYNFARHQDPSDPLIFGGDFNVAPKDNAMDPIYAEGGGGASGAMEEVDACPGKHGRAHRTKTCNRTTHEATPNVKHREKNDYIFGSHKSFKDESATIVKSSYSDHDLLVGSLYLCASGNC